jgi:hypothetical protein
MLAIACVGAGNSAARSEAPIEERKASKKKPTARALNPWDRPEGSIVDQPARYYVWYDKQGWHLRTTAKKGRHFHGKIRVSNAKIASCLSVGLKNDKQKKATDSWRVNESRSELEFDFRTARLSDGFDWVVEGDEGEIEFELYIDKAQNPRTVFVGRGLEHPTETPFRLPATPAKPK